MYYIALNIFNIRLNPHIMKIYSDRPDETDQTRDVTRASLRTRARDDRADVLPRARAVNAFPRVFARFGRRARRERDASAADGDRHAIRRDDDDARRARDDDARRAIERAIDARGDR